MDPWTVIGWVVVVWLVCAILGNAARGFRRRY
jgi:hypothetical protein